MFNTYFKVYLNLNNNIKFMDIKKISKFLQKNIPNSVCEVSNNFFHLLVKLKNGDYNIKYSVDPLKDTYKVVEFSALGKIASANDTIKIPVSVAIEANAVEKIIEKLPLKKDISDIKFSKDMYEDPN